MSYSIDEGLEDADRRAKHLTKLQKQFPDAKLGDLPNGVQVWTSDDAYNRANDFAIVAGKDSNVVYLCPMWRNGDLEVYANSWHWMHAYEWRNRVRKDAPLFSKIVAAVLKESGEK